MNQWKRCLIPNGFEWINHETRTGVTVQVRENRWTATLSVLLASGFREKASFYAEDTYQASLQKCLLYIWRALSITDKATFDPGEALVDLTRFAA